MSKNTAEGRFLRMARFGKEGKAHARMSKNDRREFLRMVGCFLGVWNAVTARPDFFVKNSGNQENPNPAVFPSRKPETIQRNSRKLKSRCIAAAKIPKTYSGIREIPNLAVVSLQKNRKHTAEFKKTQIPLYSHCFANDAVWEARNWQRKFLRTPPFKKKPSRTCNNIQILTSIPSNQAYSCNHRRKNNKKPKNNSKCD